MDERKSLILSTIIKEHINTAAPVGSGVLVEKYKLNISPATARNEMSKLEEEGYIVQPYTSAGRIPTEKAYKLYLSKLKNTKKLSDPGINEINSALKKNDEQGIKDMAKIMSRISNNAVFWAFHKNNIYYTGISNLFQQPEFSQLELIYDISGIIDRIDEIIGGIYHNVKNGVRVYIGSENPFGAYCSTIISKYQNGNNLSLFGILGPMRMDYEKNLGLVNYINEKLIK